MNLNSRIFNFVYQARAVCVLLSFYVQKYFSPATKHRYEKLVDEIFDAYRERINKLDWMSDATKKAAVSSAIRGISSSLMRREPMSAKPEARWSRKLPVCSKWPISACTSPLTNTPETPPRSKASRLSSSVAGRMSSKQSASLPSTPLASVPRHKSFG